MGWLAHHEFGLDHRQFVMGGDPVDGDPTGLDYWLSLWCQVYTHLLEHHAGDVTLVSYDRLCTDPDTVWGALAERAALPPGAETKEVLKRSSREITQPVTAELQERAAAIHAELLKKAL